MDMLDDGDTFRFNHQNQHSYHFAGCQEIGLLRDVRTHTSVIVNYEIDRRFEHRSFRHLAQNLQEAPIDCALPFSTYAWRKPIELSAKTKHNALIIPHFTRKEVNDYSLMALN